VAAREGYSWCGMTNNTVLALNAGSSSIKFAVFQHDAPATPLYRGLLDKHAGHPEFAITDSTGKPMHAAPIRAVPDADLAAHLLDRLAQLPGEIRPTTVGHRVVHGGPDFFQPVALDAAVLAQLDALTPFAPLHQPRCLAPIRSLLRTRPELCQVACFDTAFHRDLAPAYRSFPVPDLDPGIRRYGFHGLSFQYVSEQLGISDARTVVAHLGNGASLCALRNGKSVNTSMSLTPLDGLMMATRSGAIDPGLVIYLQRSKRMSADEIEDLLYHRSGLLGLSGLSADMRTLLASKTIAAQAAIEQYCARVAEQTAVMATSLGGIDSLVFTGGIGENSPDIRNRIASRLNWLGIRLNMSANERHERTISATDSRIETLVIPTDEEAVIAAHAASLRQQARDNGAPPQ
jgi:acetate kinase